MSRRFRLVMGLHLLAAAIAGAPVAAAEDGGEGAFWLRREALRVVVTDWLAPPAPELPVDPIHRRCRVLVAVDPAGPDPITAEARACERGLGRLSQDVVRGWTWRVEGPRPSAKVQVAEFIFVFPLADRPGPVRIFYRPDPALEASLPAGVEVMEVRPTLQAAGAYPLDRVGNDTRDTRCRAELQVSSTGLLEDVLVEGCDDAFVYAAEQMFRSWSFEPPTLDQAPATGFATYEVDFLRDPANPEDAGRLVVRFPEEPLIGGGRVTRMEQVEAVLPTLPTSPPAFQVHHEGSASLRVWEAPLPEDLRWPARTDCGVRVLAPLRAPISVRVHGCPAELADRLERSGASWLASAGPVRTGEKTARLDATIRVGPSDPPRLILPARSIVPPLPAFDAHLGAEAPAIVRTRVPPKVGAGAVPPEASCSATVWVSERGAPTRVEIGVCSPGLAGPLAKAVRAWRWDPAVKDGEPVASEETVRFEMR